ncbi:hypothetical protein ABK040_011117 [Willaertia magna]
MPPPSRYYNSSSTPSVPRNNNNNNSVNSVKPQNYNNDNNRSSSTIIPQPRRRRSSFNRESPPTNDQQHSSSNSSNSLTTGNNGNNAYSPFDDDDFPPSALTTNALEKIFHSTLQLNGESILAAVDNLQLKREQQFPQEKKQRYTIREILEVGQNNPICTVKHDDLPELDYRKLDWGIIPPAKPSTLDTKRRPPLPPNTTSTTSTTGSSSGIGSGNSINSSSRYSSTRTVSSKGALWFDEPIDQKDNTGTMELTDEELERKKAFEEFIRMKKLQEGGNGGQSISLVNPLLEGYEEGGALEELGGLEGDDSLEKLEDNNMISSNELEDYFNSLKGGNSGGNNLLNNNNESNNMMNNTTDSVSRFFKQQQQQEQSLSEIEKSFFDLVTPTSNPVKNPFGVDLNNNQNVDVSNIVVEKKPTATMDGLANNEDTIISNLLTKKSGKSRFGFGTGQNGGTTSSSTTDSTGSGSVSTPPILGNMFATVNNNNLQPLQPPQGFKPPQLGNEQPPMNFFTLSPTMNGFDPSMPMFGGMMQPPNMHHMNIPPNDLPLFMRGDNHHHMHEGNQLPEFFLSNNNQKGHVFETFIEEEINNPNVVNNNSNQSNQFDPYLMMSAEDLEKQFLGNSSQSNNNTNDSNSKINQLFKAFEQKNDQQSPILTNNIVPPTNVPQNDTLTNTGNTFITPFQQYQEHKQQQQESVNENTDEVNPNTPVKSNNVKKGTPTPTSTTARKLSKTSSNSPFVPSHLMKKMGTNTEKKIKQKATTGTTTTSATTTPQKTTTNTVLSSSPTNQLTNNENKQQTNQSTPQQIRILQKPPVPSNNNNTMNNNNTSAFAPFSNQQQQYNNGQNSILTRLFTNNQQPPMNNMPSNAPYIPTNDFSQALSLEELERQFTTGLNH